MFCHLSMSTKIPTLSISLRKEERGPEGVRVHSLVFLEVVKNASHTCLSIHPLAKEYAMLSMYTPVRLSLLKMIRGTGTF